MVTVQELRRFSVACLALAMHVAAPCLRGALRAMRLGSGALVAGVL